MPIRLRIENRGILCPKLAYDRHYSTTRRPYLQESASTIRVSPRGYPYQCQI